MAAGDFSRDLGYLDAFLDRLEAHAATLPPAAGARLASLIGEERRRWTEVRGLLAGEEPGEPNRAPEASPPPPDAAAPVGIHPYTRALRRGLAMLPRDPAPPRQAPSSFTVGSLKPR